MFPGERERGTRHLGQRAGQEGGTINCEYLLPPHTQLLSQIQQEFPRSQEIFQKVTF